MEGFAEIELNLKLKERGWKEIPLNGVYKIGKLSLCHGLYTNQYHARKHVDIFGTSVIYGHNHDVQEHTRITYGNTEVHKGKSIGCLCDVSPSYLKNKPNKWVHAFSVVYTYDDGNFNEYTINIINGQFVWNGKPYGK